MAGNPCKSFKGNEIVNVLLDPDGKLTVDKERVCVKAGGKLTFRIHKDDTRLRGFAILMKDRTPFGSGDVWVGGEKGPGVRVRIDGAANGAEWESYRYSIIATDGTDTYHKDPEVVIGPPNGGDDDGEG
ncbi:MAG: hypothetical protein P8177_04150 [Gemmatimonadota bacterium]